MIRCRNNYWSCSKFANFISKTFGDFTKPDSATYEEWNTFKLISKQKSKFVYWFTETILDRLQNIFLFPWDVYNTVRVYCKNRFITKIHYLPTKLKPGEWFDMDTRLLHGIFESLVWFVEVEKAMSFSSEKFDKSNGVKHLQWEVSLKNDDGTLTNQAKYAKEILEIYLWWTTIRPYRKDPIDRSGLCKFYDKQELFSGHKMSSEWRAATDLSHKIEQEQYDEDSKMMKKLIDIRNGLWT